MNKMNKKSIFLIYAVLMSRENNRLRQEAVRNPEKIWIQLSLLSGDSDDMFEGFDVVVRCGAHELRFEAVAVITAGAGPGARARHGVVHD